MKCYKVFELKDIYPRIMTEDEFNSVMYGSTMEEV